jgi:hypothetical protein
MKKGKTNNEGKGKETDAEKKEDIHGSAKTKWSEKKDILFAVAVIFLMVLASGVYFYIGKSGVEDEALDLTVVRDIGAIKVRGDGLPGYDIDRDGEADYLSKGFGYYKELHESGGFEYRSGIIELEDFELNLTLPNLNFEPTDIVESGVGSVVSFAANNESSSISVTVIYKTLGPALNTYNVFIKYSDGETYNIIDVISENGDGTIEENEVEIAGHVVFRE